MGLTKIEWTTYTWNPVTGCKHGCPFCYARRIAERIYPEGFEPTYRPERLTQPYHWPPGRIFVCSMGELFGDWVPPAWQEAVFKVVRDCPQHQFLFLTKAPHNLKKMNPWPQNAWAGASAINQVMAERAIAGLRETDAPIRFLSCEPLLGPIDVDLSGLSWLIIGAQTKPYNPPKKRWVEVLLARAAEAGIPVFLKDNLNWPQRIQEWPDGQGRLHRARASACDELSGKGTPRQSRLF